LYAGARQMCLSNEKIMLGAFGRAMNTDLGGRRPPAATLDAPNSGATTSVAAARSVACHVLTPLPMRLTGGLECYLVSWASVASAAQSTGASSFSA